MTPLVEDPAAVFLAGVGRAGNYWLAFFRDRPTDLAIWERVGGHALRALRWCADCAGHETLTADLAHVLQSQMMRLGQWHEWAILLQHAIAAIESSVDLDRLVRAKAELCTVYFRLHRLDEAMALAQHCYDIGVTQQKRSWQYAGTIAMAEAHLNAQAFDLAFRCAEEATMLAALMEDPVKEADGLANAAWALLGQGITEEAEQRLERALALTIAAGDFVWQAKARLFLGHAARAQGRLALALERYHAAFSIVEGYGDQVGCGTILSAMGLVYTELGEWAAARKTLSEALQILERHGNTPAVNITRQRLEILAERAEASVRKILTDDR